MVRRLFFCGRGGGGWWGFEGGAAALGASVLEPGLDLTLGKCQRLGERAPLLGAEVLRLRKPPLQQRALRRRETHLPALALALPTAPRRVRDACNTVFFLLQPCHYVSYFTLLKNDLKKLNFMFKVLSTLIEKSQARYNTTKN